MKTERVIALDGYDAAGKTTLARLLADRTGGRYVKAFTGDVGALVGWLYATGWFAAMDVVARAGLEGVYAQNRDAPGLIFDRHWITGFALLPESCYANWGALPKTFLCWADAATTVERLRARGERLRAPGDYRAFAPRYRELALRFGATTLDTTRTAPEESLGLVLNELEREGVLW